MIKNQFYKKYIIKNLIFNPKKANNYTIYIKKVIKVNININFVALFQK